jgi:hypothetical protein
MVCFLDPYIQCVSLQMYLQNMYKLIKKQVFYLKIPALDQTFL